MAAQHKLLQKQLAAIKRKKFESQQRLNEPDKELPKANVDEIEENQKIAEEEKRKEKILVRKLKEGEFA